MCLSKVYPGEFYFISKPTELLFSFMETGGLSESSIKYVSKIFQKTNISYPLIRTRTCAYNGVRNNSFSECLAYILNG